MRAFALGSSGTATNTATALMGSRLLLKVDSGSGYEFDDPYFKGWVQVNTLRDIGAPSGINLLAPGSEGL